MRKLVLPLLVLCSLPLRAQAPYLVKDINTVYSVSSKSSLPTEFVSYHNRIFFVATTEGKGTELWSTDGTSGGTSMVADIAPGTASSTPGSLAVVNGTLQSPPPGSAIRAPPTIRCPGPPTAMPPSPWTPPT